MPAGEYTIRMARENIYDDDSKKLRSFELEVNAVKEKVTLAYKDYDMANLYNLSNCLGNSNFCDMKVCSVKEYQYKTERRCRSTFCRADADKCTW
jgi:rRNA maturation endonuclease Nob1